jgi:hypothetical protein
MLGCITDRDVLRHPLVICRLWGLGCYLRCLHALVTRRRCTFLQLSVVKR